MGNSHGAIGSVSNSTPAAKVASSRRRLAELRRLSAPSCRARLAAAQQSSSQSDHRRSDIVPNSPSSSTCPTTYVSAPNDHCDGNGRSVQKPENSIDEPTVRPRIQVNGEDSIDDPSSVPVTSRSNAAEKRWKFFTSSNRSAIRSLEEGINGCSMELSMRPLKDRARSLSPLKQLRTYSFRSTPSEESYLSDTQQNCIRRSWCCITERLSREKYDFGYFVLLRVFNRAPHLKSAFGVNNYQTFDDLPYDHALYRHSRLFTKVIDIAVRNVDRVECEVAPTIFRYGQRHYHNNAREYFDEESVRLFCSQVVCTVVDVLSPGFSDNSGTAIGDSNGNNNEDQDEEDVEQVAECLDAWIELMRYIGTKLLDGFRFEHLTNTKKLTINTNDHVFFLL